MEDKEIIQEETKDERDTDTPILKIDLNTPLSVDENSSLVATKSDVELLATIEVEIGKQLTEKAEKTNLTVHNVKTIIRQVLTHEHVLALIQKDDKPSFPEPKLTRAKTKELLSTNPLPLPPPWTPQPPPSEIHALVNEELPEDSSGDEEYIPGEDEEHDDNDDSIASESDTSSLPPPTPPSLASIEDSCNQTSWTEDGVFKIPPTRSSTAHESSDEANIALRTRSKINLSSTPLEVIEKLFIPPDITTDMYDMECDDEEWKDFLKGFAEPLEVAAKQTEDEEHDPEYNILAEYHKIEKVEKIDRKEEFRDDKAVTVTKKELKELWEELFEYIENASDPTEEQDEPDSQLNDTENTTLLNDSDVTSEVTTEETIKLDSTVQSENDHEPEEVKAEPNNFIEPRTEITLPKNILVPAPSTTKAIPEVVMVHEQICILEQQMRQHIQILTQNFLLMYEHPEYHDYCSNIKEYLLNFKYLSHGKTFSIFRPVNLEPALKLVDYWRDLFKSNGEEVKECKLHVKRELAKLMQYFAAGNYDYIPSFPRLVLKTISTCEVFLYPGLLPKIPFKAEVMSKKGFTESEDRLLVFGLDHFTNFLQQQDGMNKHKNKYSEIPLTIIVSHIHEYLMPHREKASILRHIRLSKDQRCADNPIKLYFSKKQLPKIVHYIYPLQRILPPYKRSPNELPTQIRNFVFSNTITSLRTERTPVIMPSVPPPPNQPLYVLSSTPVLCQNTLVPIKPKLSSPESQVNIEQTPSRLSRGRKRIPNTVKNKSFQNKLCEYGENLRKFNTSIEKIVTIFIRQISLRKLISFCQQKNNEPNFNSTSISIQSESQQIVLQDESISSTMSGSPPFSNLTFSTLPQLKNGSSTSRDYSDDTIFSNVTVRNQYTNRKEKGFQPSGAEKKKAKIKREFLANLSVAAPESPESIKHREEAFAFAFYDNIRETLVLEEYHKLMQILNEFESGDAVDLYRKIEPILAPKYNDLLEKFLLFLKEKEAAELGLLMPWINMNNRAKFLRKIEIYFKDQPAQLKKVYNTLADLSRMKNASMEKIKDSMLPLLKSNRILTDLFLQNFMGERPPANILEGPYETIDIHKEPVTTENEMYETIVVPNTEEKYGGKNCICNCHIIEDNIYKSRLEHCSSCGLRFVNGKIFVQSGRSIQPATVSFKTNPNANHSARLLGTSVTGTPNHRGQKRKSGSSPNENSKTICKEDFDEGIDNGNENKRKPKCQKPKTESNPVRTESFQKDIRSRRGSTSQNKKEVENLVIKNDCAKAKEINYKKINKSLKLQDSDEMSQKKPIGAQHHRKEDNKVCAVKLGQPKCSFEGILDISADIRLANKMPDHLVTVRDESSSRHTRKLSNVEQQSKIDQKANETSYCNLKGKEKPLTLQEEGGGEFQNLENESDSSCSSTTSNVQQSDDRNNEPPWSREEDTVILETFQKEDDKDCALKIISDKLPNRTLSEIKSRFSTLMTILIESLKKGKT